LTQTDEIYGGAKYKEAYTGVINIQLEYDVNELGEAGTKTSTNIVHKNSDNTWQYSEVLTAQIHNMDFGITEVAKQDFDLEKKIDNVKVTLANGQVLIDGNPETKDLGYTQYFPYDGTTSERLTRVKMEIDDEMLYGSTLEVRYKVIATNKSELSYVTKDYYRYGIAGTEDQVEGIIFSKLIDYLDNDLNIPASELNDRIHLLNQETGKDMDGNNDGLEQENFKLSDYLRGTAKNNNAVADILNDKADNYNNKLVLTSDNKTIPIGNKTEDVWTYTVNRTITPQDDLEYTNDIEVIGMTTTNHPTTSSVPGTYNTENATGETDSFQDVVMITDPTGGNRSLAIYIVGAVAIIILGAGIVVIKKKVL
jgi:hypothetical protein